MSQGRSKSCWSILFTIIHAAVCCVQAQCDIVDVAYSFKTKKKGGIASVTVDTRTGVIVGEKVLLDEKDCRNPNKLRRSPDSLTLIATDESEKGPHLFVVDRRDPKHNWNIDLPAMPDELRVTGPYGIVTCADDWIAWVDYHRGRVVSRWNVKGALHPAGNKPEDAHLVRDGRFAVVSFQKDSEKGKNRGNRLAIYDLPKPRLRADIQVVRNHPELHFQNNLQQRGPGPEVVLVSEETDTLLVTLDLYGAILLTDWRAALEGRLRNSKYLPSSLDGSWGTAFPDRAGLLRVKGRICALVFNAGTQGGAALVDLKGRAIISRVATPPGLERPVFLESLTKAYSVCSGKTKKRATNDVDKWNEPQKAIYEFRFEGDTSPEMKVRAFPLEMYAVKIAPINTESKLLLVAAGKKTDSADTLMVFDPRGRRVLDTRKAAGDIRRFEND